jgi:hypothetical protein
MLDKKDKKLIHQLSVKIEEDVRKWQKGCSTKIDKIITSSMIKCEDHNTVCYKICRELQEKLTQLWIDRKTKYKEAAVSEKQSVWNNHNDTFVTICESTIKKCRETIDADN